MTIAILLATLVVFDAGLAGFRAAAGRDGRIEKRSYFRFAVARAFGGAAILLALDVGIVALLVAVAPDPAAAWATMLRAGELCVWIFGAFATLTLGAFAFWFSPIEEYRLLSSIIVLGPLTLLRPLVIVGGLAAACVVVPDLRVWIAAACACVSMLAFEPVIGRFHARRWRVLAAPDSLEPQAVDTAGPLAAGVADGVEVEH